MLTLVITTAVLAKNFSVNKQNVNKLVVRHCCYRSMLITQNNNWHVQIEVITEENVLQDCAGSDPCSSISDFAF